MKKKVIHLEEEPESLLTPFFGVLVLLLPLLALTPNFFLIPDLTYMGMATQEVVFAVTTLVCLALGLIVAARLPGAFTLTREQMLLAAPLAAFVLWQLVSLAWAPDWAESVRMSGLWFGFAVFALTALWQATEQSAPRIYYVLLLFTFILTFSQMYEYSQFEQMLGVFFSHGITAELLALLLPLFLVIYLCEKRNALALVSLLAAALSLAAILLTVRRGALLGVLAACVGIGIALLSRQLQLVSKQRLLIIAAGLVLVITPLLIFKRDYVISRFRSAFTIRTAQTTYAADIGLTSRAVLWLTAWEMGKDNILAGVGNGGFSARYGAYKRHFAENQSYARLAAAAETEDYDEIRSPLAHSEYLQIFAELGLVGTLLFAAFWLQVFWRLWQRRRAKNSYWALGALFGLLSFAISSAMSAFSFRYPPSMFLLACVLGIGFSVKPTDAAKPAAAPFALPKAAVLAVLAVAVLAALGLLSRNYNVYASQRTQSQLDFRFALNNVAVNDSFVRRYRQVLGLDPANAGAHLGFGLLLFQMKNPQDAIKYVEYGLQHGYSRPYAYLLLAFCYEQTGDPARALQILADCLKSFPKSVVARAAYAELLRKQGQSDLAREQRELLGKVDGKLAKSWELALRMKDEEAAKEAQRLSLTPPGLLEPQLVRVLVQARAYHYLKAAAPPPELTKAE